MKFGHRLKESLQGDVYPPHWVEIAVPYRQLKKVLSKVRAELTQKGYDPETLQRLHEQHNALYSLQPGSSSSLRPKLRVRVELEDGTPVGLSAALQALTLCDTSSNSSTRSLSPRPARGLAAVAATAKHAQDGHHQQQQQQPQPQPQSPPASGRWLDIPLTADSAFFDLLQADVDKLDMLLRREEAALRAQAEQLGEQVCAVARPPPARLARLTSTKTDLYRWRHILRLYLDAQVFFAASEAERGARASDSARGQLVWFQDQVRRQGLLGQFKLEASTTAYAQFLALNLALLRSLQFQELNQMAVTKIIKKFDKKTALGIKESFSATIRSTGLMMDSIATNTCAELSLCVVDRVPQPNEYDCPICCSICWLPVRLACGHLFCIHCMVRMQDRRTRCCPLCRAPTVLQANEGMSLPGNIDEQLIKYLELWFRKETKEKHIINQTERGKDLLGPDFVYHRCSVM